MNPLKKPLLAFLAVLATGGTCFAQGSPCERVYEWSAWLQREDGKWDTTVNPVIFVCEDKGVMEGVGFLSLDEPARVHWLSADQLMSEGWALLKDGLMPVNTEAVMSRARVSFNPADYPGARESVTLDALNRMWSTEKNRLLTVKSTRMADSLMAPARASASEVPPEMDVFPPNFGHRTTHPRFHNDEEAATEG